MLSPDEILDLAKKASLKVHDLLRTNAPVYKERKAELIELGEIELARFISEEPTLIKRPIVMTDKGVVIGLNEEAILQVIQ